MKKWYEMIVKAIEITKQYTHDEVKQLSWLFSYLNNLDIDEEWFGTWVSAKWLWKLLNPLTRTWKEQPFREWWESVSNLARLKDNKDYEKREEIDPNLMPDFEYREKSPYSKLALEKEKKHWGAREWAGRPDNFDYILTLRAWEYCAVLTKWDSWDLYRRFIFDIKDEFLRLVFRKWKSIDTRNEFTKSISQLEFMKELKEKNKFETLSNTYWEMTNLIYLELFWVKAIEYKELNDIPKEYFAKDFFTKDWLFDLEKVENKLSAVIGYIQPKTRDDLKNLIIDFLNKEVKIIKAIWN